VLIRPILLFQLFFFIYTMLFSTIVPAESYSHHYNLFFDNSDEAIKILENDTDDVDPEETENESGQDNPDLKETSLSCQPILPENRDGKVQSNDPNLNASAAALESGASAIVAGNWNTTTLAISRVITFGANHYQQV